MPTQDYNQLTTCFYVVEDGPDDLARPLHVTFDIAPTTAGAAAMLASMAVFPLVSLASRKMPRAEVDKIFACYDEPVTVHQRVALEEEAEG